MTNKLKPCPFCGGEASIRASENSNRFFVGCFNDGCPVNPCSGDFLLDGVYDDEMKQAAVDEWNTRAERTCEMEWDEDGEGDELYPVGHVTCSACGAWLYAVNTMRFCPNCGAKVVGK